MVFSKKYCPVWVYDCVVAQSVSDFILYGVDMAQPCRKFAGGLTEIFEEVSLFISGLEHPPKPKVRSTDTLNRCFLKPGKFISNQLNIREITVLLGRTLTALQGMATW